MFETITSLHNSETPVKKRKTCDTMETTVHRYIVLNSRETLHILSGNELCKLFDQDSDRLLFQTQAGDIQRNVDVGHLSDLKMFQLNHKEIHGHYSFSTQMVVAEHNNKYALVDGQHRLETIRYLLDVDSDNVCSISVPVLVVQLSCVSEYDELFVAVNKNKPVRLYKNVHEWKTIGKYLEQYFNQHYSMYIKTTEHPNVPHLNVDSLMKYIDDGDYIRKMAIGYEELIKEIEELNNCYRLHWKELLQTTRYLPNVAMWAEKCEKKNPQRPLYLGMFRKFEWVDRILLKLSNPSQFQSYLMMKHVPVNYRGKINKKLRRIVWRKRNNDTLTGNCYVCQKNLQYEEFECGHVVSVFAGGVSSVDNLEPICRMCNSDMGIEHLETFKTTFFENGVTDEL